MGAVMKDVMLDFEAFGFRKSAIVCQIGACYFDRDTGEVGDKLSINVDARTAEVAGGQFDADTVYWWLSQSPEAIKSITSGELIDVTTAFITLNNFLKDAKTIWSHATFDFVILTETLNNLKIKPKFKYKVARDIRTLVELSGITIKKIPREGIHHNAIDDCIYQVKYCVEAMKQIKGKQT